MGYFSWRERGGGGGGSKSFKRIHIELTEITFYTNGYNVLGYRIYHRWVWRLYEFQCKQSVVDSITGFERRIWGLLSVGESNLQRISDRFCVGLRRLSTKI